MALALAASVSFADADREFGPEHTLDAIDRASEDTGVSHALLKYIVGCETGWTYNPYAEGDRGHSHGAAQLNDYGNALPKFFAVGYTDMYDPYQAVYFMAEALRGDHRPLHRGTWSC